MVGRPSSVGSGTRGGDKCTGEFRPVGRLSAASESYRRTGVSAQWAQFRAAGDQADRREVPQGAMTAVPARKCWGVPHRGHPHVWYRVQGVPQGCHAV